MRKQMILSLLVLTAVAMTFAINEASAEVSLQVNSPNLSFSLSDYKPAPPNVFIHNDGGRPYYVERDRRVYMEKRKHGKHYKKEKKHHEDNGNHYGEEKHGKHGH